MKDFQSFMLLICFVSYICSSQCCISTGFNGCSLMSYGGRLIIDQNANTSPDEQLLFGSRKRFFILQPQPGMNRRWGLRHGQFSGSGVGVIWRSNSYCQGPHSPCAVTGRRPCMDSRRPCALEPPSYSPHRTGILQFSQISPSSINVTWPAWDEATDRGYGPVVEYKIQIREQGQTKFNEVSVGLALSHQFENLTEDTEYEFRVLIVRDYLYGEGPFSDVQATRTSAKEPPSYSPDRNEPLQFSDITPSSIDVTYPAWNAATDLGNGPIVEYRIQMKEKGQADFEEFSAGLALSYRFDNLTEDTEYEFRVVIVRSVKNRPYGVGPPSEIQTIKTTLKEPPYYSPDRTEPLQFFDIKPTSITASWPAWDESTDLGSGPVVDYKILIGELGSHFNEVSVGLKLFHRFQNLTQDTEYEFRVVIVRDHPQGAGPPSRIQMMRTATIESTDVEPFFNDSDEQIQTNGSTGFVFSNEATADGGIPVNQFRDFVEESAARRKLGCSLKYGGRLRFRGDVATELLFRGGRERIFIFQQPQRVLGRGRGHPVYFPGSSGRGIIWKGEELCKRFQFEQSVCPATEASPCLDSIMPCSDTTPPSYSEETPLRFSDVTPTSVTVTWPAWDSTTDLGEGPIVTYIIEFRETGGDTFHAIRKGLDLSHQFENLVPDTEYEFHVVLVSDHPAGEGPPSRVQKQRTPSQGVYRGDQDIILYPGESVTVPGMHGIEHLPLGGRPNGYIPVRNLTASQSGVRKLTLSWNPPDLEPTLYFTVGYVVRYVLMSHIACFENVTGAEEIRLVNETEVDLTDLEDYAYYKISVSPLTRTVRPDVDIEVEGEAVSIVESTLPNAPVATLQPVEVSGPSSSSTNLKFSWNQVTCENQNGPIFKYNCVLYLTMDGRPPERITEVNVTYRSYVFTNLLPCGRYRLEVTPQNDMKSAATETVEVSTSPAQFGLVRDFSITPNFGQDNFTVEWQPPSETFCPVTSYTLKTTIQKQQACSECVFEEVNSISGIQDTSYTLHGLLPYTTYIVSVTTHGNDDLTGTTFEDVLTTPKRAPSSSPTVMFHAASSTDKSVVFSWDQVPCRYLNGAFFQYKYSLKLTGSDVVIEEGSIRNQSQSGITIAGLSPCTNCTFSIRVDNDVYDGQFNTIYGTTALGTPGNDMNLVLAPGISEACEDSAPCLIATWRKPRSNNCPVTNQRISLYQIDDDNCRNTSELKLSFEKHHTQFQQNFTELAPNSLYRVVLEMGNSAGSAVSTQELRTGESAPSGAPEYVQLNRPIRGRRINITWAEPACGHRHGIITGYKYKLRFQEEDFMTGETSNNWHFFEGLERGTRYSFTVSAFNEKGSGPYTHEENNEYYYFRTRV